MKFRNRRRLASTSVAKVSSVHASTSVAKKRSVAKVDLVAKTAVSRLNISIVAVGIFGVLGVLSAGCSTSPANNDVHALSATSVIQAVGAENEYANVISQIGGKYVNATSIMNNPNTDPHTFESSPSVARQVAAAQLVVQNGLGYDTFMNRIESAAPDPNRKVIDVQALLGLADNTPNPHLWYKPTTMPKVAAAIARDLSELDPSHKTYFASNLSAFATSLIPWTNAIAQFKSEFSNTAVAVTEPVADYLLQAAGLRILTPWVLQSDIMNGVDPPPQDVTLENNLLSTHQVKVFLYNQQVTDSVTQSFLSTAQKYKVPVVGVYETMPTPGYSYQSWMLAEVNAIRSALLHKVSTQKL